MDDLMEAFRTHTGLVVPLDRADVDTDQIIPKQFLKRIDRSGYGQFLFHDWRAAQDGATSDFVLDQERYRGASILVTGPNFGCGSSREHAAWALRDFGFRAILAPSFADIFRENADQNGLAALAIPGEVIADLMERASQEAPLNLTVDLEARTVAESGEIVASIDIDDFRRTCLLEGLDRIGLTLRHEGAIDAYEQRRLVSSSASSAAGTA
jgi:3-isopropylmalate/(R)-2-methylmalate dehydratase small subunit